MKNFLQVLLGLAVIFVIPVMGYLSERDVKRELEERERKKKAAKQAE